MISNHQEFCKNELLWKMTHGSGNELSAKKNWPFLLEVGDIHKDSFAQEATTTTLIELKWIAILLSSRLGIIDYLANRWRHSAASLWDFETLVHDDSNNYVDEHEVANDIRKSLFVALMSFIRMLSKWYIKRIWQWLRFFSSRYKAAGS